MVFFEFASKTNQQTVATKGHPSYPSTGQEFWSEDWSLILNLLWLPGPATIATRKNAATHPPSGRVLFFERHRQIPPQLHDLAMLSLVITQICSVPAKTEKKKRKRQHIDANCHGVNSILRDCVYSSSACHRWDPPSTSKQSLRSLHHKTAASFRRKAASITGPHCSRGQDGHLRPLKAPSMESMESPS